MQQANSQMLLNKKYSFKPKNVDCIYGVLIQNNAIKTRNNNEIF